MTRRRSAAPRACSALLLLGLGCVLGWVLGWVLGCGTDAPALQDGSPGGPPAEELDASALADLGYVDYVEEEPEDGNAGGLLLYAPGTCPGYVLVVAIPEARALLLARDGTVVHEWSDPEARQWSRAELGPDGDLIAVGRLAGSGDDEGGGASDDDVDAGDARVEDSNGRFLARYAADGSLRWRRLLRVHHDAELTPDGRILAVGDEPRQVDGLYIQDDRLLVLDGDGNLERDLSLHDLLSSRPRMLRPPRSTDRKHATLPDGRVDLFHTNSAAWYPFADAARHPLGGPEHVLVTVRHQDLLAVVDLASESLVWAWGPGQVRYPHEATWLANGGLLCFDNGTKGRGWSRVVEVDPTTGEVVWEYRADPPEEFFSNGRGTAEVLPNGNVLVASSNQARVFEITREGEVVWRYELRDRRGRGVVLRAAFCPAPVVESWLAKGR